MGSKRVRHYLETHAHNNNSQSLLRSAKYFHTSLKPPNDSVGRWYFYYAHFPIWKLRLKEFKWASFIAQLVKNLPAMQETQVWFLGWEDPLEKEITTHSGVLAWRIPMDRGAWQAIVHGVTRVGHD